VKVKEIMTLLAVGEAVRQPVVRDDQVTIGTSGS
jgi:hypothetical protein